MSLRAFALVLLVAGPVRAQPLPQAVADVFTGPGLSMVTVRGLAERLAPLGQVQFVAPCGLGLSPGSTGRLVSVELDLAGASRCDRVGQVSGVTVGLAGVGGDELATIKAAIAEKSGNPCFDGRDLKATAGYDLPLTVWNDSSRSLLLILSSGASGILVVNDYDKTLRPDDPVEAASYRSLMDRVQRNLPRSCG